MKNNLKPTYFFGVTHQENGSHALRLDLIGANPYNFRNGNLERTPPEILKLKSWDITSLHFWGSKISINCYTDSYNDYKTEIRFYQQCGDLLLGEDCETNRAVLARMYGPTNEYGMCVPEIIGLSISNIKFDNINAFNYPTSEHAKLWEDAVKTKCQMLHANAA
jgi:hypothetical protein